MTGYAFFIVFTLVPLGAGVFYFRLTIVHWQFDMICQKWCSVCAILSGLEIGKYADKKGMNILRYLFTVCY